MLVQPDRKYGILLSGGLDSAVLCYLMIKENPNIDLQIFTIPKYDGAAVHASNVVEHFNQKFKLSLPNPVHVGNPDVHHSFQTFIAVKDILKNYSIDVLYMAVNTNPPELNKLKWAPVRKLESKHEKVQYPFARMHKDEIVQLMFAEGQEDLADITHSCTEQSIGRCNRCWQCTERAWAFSKINKVDTGKN
jgi:7-cyano-7-deazaguanine synthase in queuosine biosynthesis